MNMPTISDVYGFWHPAGIHLFFRFPKFSFIDINDETKLTSDYFLIENPNSSWLDKLCIASKRKIYIHIDKNEYSNMDYIIGSLPFCLLRYGKKVDGAVKLFDEITFGVKGKPELHKEVLLEKLKSDRSLSRYSLIRPIETYDDYVKE